MKPILLTTAAAMMLSSSSSAQEARSGLNSDSRIFKQDWKVCKKETDCVVVGGGCYGLEATNKKFESEAKSYIHWFNAVSECAPVQTSKNRKTENNKKIDVTCIKGTCVIK